MARTTIGKRSVGRDGALHVHGKASNGEGSIYRDSDGAWRATYSVPGEARPRRVRGKTREEAIARRTVKLEELSQIQSSTFHRDATVAELAAWWLDVVARHRVRASTLGTYSQRVERITNTIGQLPARSLKPERIARWQSDLLKSGLDVKQQSGIDKSGRDLMAQAFAGDPPPIDLRLEQGRSGEDEQAGFKLIFMGVMQGIRNPKGHEVVQQGDPQRAVEYLGLVSVLMRRLDDAESAAED